MVTLDVGGEVIWTNHGVSKITITSGTASDGPDGTFDSGLLATGESFSFTFEEHGEFTYFSQIQPWIVGTITVQKVHGDEHSDMGTDHESEMKHDSETDHESEMKHDDKEMHMPEGDVSATGMLSDGTVIKLWASVPTKDEMMEIMMEFEDAKHVNHDLLVTQNGEEVLHDTGAHHMSGFGTHTTAPLHSSDPVDVVVTFQGYGMNDDKTGPIGEQVKFANVIPEFGTIAMMVLSVAIISIVAVTAKSRVIPRF
jgi:predicted secreted protein with PEFG-CTERM motif